MRIFNLDTPLDKEVRYNHEELCGSSGADYRERLYVKRTKDGWLWTCHNCGKKGFKKYTPTEYLILLKRGEEVTRITEKEIVVNEKFSMPNSSPFIPRAYDWLHQYGITTPEINEHKFYYSCYNNRLIMPIKNVHGDITGWQGRAMNVPSKSNPKYITQYRTDNPDDHYYCECSIGCDTLVLVEDIISAIKVGRHCDALAVLGSPKLPTESLLSVLRIIQPRHVIVWLDPDKQREATKWRNRLEVLGPYPSWVIYSDVDPKCYTDTEIIIELMEAETYFEGTENKGEE